MRCLDLFSGIGGFALAASWVWEEELELIGFCEKDKYCQKVLTKNFPDIPIYPDITKLDGKEFTDIDLVTGGFPCQDISVAGKGAGIDGKRSGLWSELLRIISEVQPRYALIENVPMLIHRGLGRVLCDLTHIGYDCEWQIIGADDVGARHRRKRIWIVAYPRLNGRGSFGGGSIRGNGNGELEEGIGFTETVAVTGSSETFQPMAHSAYSGRNGTKESRQDYGIQSTIQSWQELCLDEPERESSLWSSGDMAHSESKGGRGRETGKQRFTSCSGEEVSSRSDTGRETISHPASIRSSRQGELEYASHKEETGEGETVSTKHERIGDIWTTEPSVGRVAHGIPSRVDRLRGLGNAIVPQCAAIIMHLIKDNMNAKSNQETN